MKLKRKSWLFCFVFLSLSFITIAQNPNWSINRADFEFQMRFTIGLKFNGENLTNTNDQVGVFVGNELRGFANITFDSDDNKYVAFLTAYSNTIGETLSFKIYNSSLNTVVDALQTETFVIDERVGGVFQSFVVSNTTLSSQAELNNFSFQGITANSNSRIGNSFNIILPTATDLTNLTPVFTVSSSANVFVNFIKQTSGSGTMNFTNPVTYQVLSEDEKVLEEYIINVTVASSTNNPTVVLSSSESAMTNKKQFQINISFSEEVTGFTKQDFQLANAVISNLTSVNGTTYSALITLVNQGSSSISIASNSVVNESQNGNLLSNTLLFQFDDKMPVLESQSHLSNQQYFELRFSEAVKNVTADDFMLSGSLSSDFSISSVQKNSDLVYNISYTGSSSESGSLFIQIINDANIKDLADNNLLNQQKEVYILNNTDNYFIANSGNWSNANNWSLERLPISTDRITINANTTSFVDVSNFSIQKITNLGTTTLNKTSSITVDEFVNSGTFTVVSDRSTSGNLLVNTASTGVIIFKKQQLLANKWHLVSVPVDGQKIIEFAENSANDIRKNTEVTPIRYAIGYYDDNQSVENKWQYYNTDINVNLTFKTNEGYAISRLTDGEISFEGTLNIDNVDKTILSNRWVALGNPYLSYYPLNKNGEQNFLSQNSNKLQIPATYVWDTIQGKYVAFTNLAISETNFIPGGKGFFVKTNNSTSISFNKDKRTINRPLAKRSTNVPFVKLKLSNSKNITVETNIIYSESATLGFDELEDIENFEGALFDINTHLVENSNNKNFTIQSLPLSQIESSVMPLNLKVAQNEKVVFLVEANNFPTDIKVYLEDKITNNFIRLDEKNTSYTFKAREDLNGIGRFYIHTNTQTLSANEENLSELSIFYQSDNKALKISGIYGEEASLKVYDVLGKEVFQTNFDGKMKNTIALSKLKSAMYIVKLITEKGRVHKKIIVE